MNAFGDKSVAWCGRVFVCVIYVHAVPQTHSVAGGSPYPGRNASSHLHVRGVRASSVL